MKNIIQFPKPKEIDELLVETFTEQQFNLFCQFLDKVKQEQIKEQEELINTLYALTNSNEKLRNKNLKLKREINKWKQKFLTMKKK